MRFEILAFAAVAATASANNAAKCGQWKYQTYGENASSGGGWTLTNTEDNQQIYKDNAGADIDWASYSGYATSKCAEAAAEAAAAAAPKTGDDEKDSAAYLASGAALAAVAASLAF